MTEKTIDENIKEAAKEETSAAFAQTARIANALDEHCMPSQFKKQIEDERAKEYEELGLKELKELIEADRKTEPSSSEIPNNCEHITEDGVTCARYPACDDCPDNPLNKVKGSERLVKGSEVTTDCRQLERSRR